MGALRFQPVAAPLRQQWLAALLLLLSLYRCSPAAAKGLSFFIADNPNHPTCLVQNFNDHEEQYKWRITYQSNITSFKKDVGENSVAIPSHLRVTVSPPETANKLNPQVYDVEPSTPETKNRGHLLTLRTLYKQAAPIVQLARLKPDDTLGDYQICFSKNPKHPAAILGGAGAPEGMKSLVSTFFASQIVPEAAYAKIEILTPTDKTKEKHDLKHPTEEVDRGKTNWDGDEVDENGKVIKKLPPRKHNHHGVDTSIETATIHNTTSTSSFFAEMAPPKSEANHHFDVQKQKAADAQKVKLSDLDQLHANLYNVERMMKEIRGETNYFYDRHNEFRATSESTFTRIWTSSVLIMVVITLLTWYMYSHIKRALIEKKMV